MSVAMCHRLMRQALAAVWTWPTTVWMAHRIISQYHIDYWCRAWVSLSTRHLSRRPTASTVSTAVNRPGQDGWNIIGQAVSPARWWPLPELLTTAKAGSCVGAVWTVTDNLLVVGFITSFLTLFGCVCCITIACSYLCGFRGQMVHGFRWVGREQLEDVVLFAINSSCYCFWSPVFLCW